MSSRVIGTDGQTEGQCHFLSCSSTTKRGLLEQKEMSSSYIYKIIEVVFHLKENVRFSSILSLLTKNSCFDTPTEGRQAGLQSY